MATAQQIEPGKYTIFDEAGEPVVEGAPDWAVSPKLKQQPPPSMQEPELAPNPYGEPAPPPPPTEAEVAALKPNPYKPKLKALPNPSGGYDLIDTEDNTPLGFGVPEVMVPWAAQNLGADGPVEAYKTPDEPLVEEEAAAVPAEDIGDVQGDYDRLMQIYGETGQEPPAEVPAEAAPAAAAPVIPAVPQAAPPPAPAPVQETPAPSLQGPLASNFGMPARLSEMPGAMAQAPKSALGVPLYETTQKPTVPESKLDLGGATIIETPQQGPPPKKGEVLPKWAAEKFNAPVETPPTVIPATPAAPAQPGAAAPVPVDPNAPVPMTPEQARVGARIPIGGGGPVRKVPEHLQLAAGGSTTVQQVSSPELEGLREQESEARINQKLAIQQAADQKAADQAQFATWFERQREQAEQELAKHESDRIKRENAINTKMALFEERARQWEASKDIDPDRYWNNKSTPSKIAAIIASALAGWVAGVRGGPNQAIAQINTEIARDVDAQKANAAKDREGVNIAHNLVALEMQRWMSPEAAEAAARALQIKATQAEVNKMMALQNKTEVIAAGREMIAALDKSYLDETVNAKKLELGQITRQYKLVPERMVGGQAYLSYKDLENKWFKEYRGKFNTNEDAWEEAKKMAWTEWQSTVPQMTGQKVYGQAIKAGRTPEEATVAANAAATSVSVANPATMEGYNGVPDDPAQAKFMESLRRLPPSQRKAALKDMLVSQARNETRAASLGKHRLEYQYKKEIGEVFRLMTQMDAYRDYGKKAIEAAKTDTSGWVTGTNEDIKRFKMLTGESQAMAFKSRLAPGTNLGEKEIKELVPEILTPVKGVALKHLPGAGDVYFRNQEVKLDSAYHAMTRRLAHIVTGLNAMTGRKAVTEEELRKQYKSYLDAAKQEMPADPAAAGLQELGAEPLED